MLLLPDLRGGFDYPAPRVLNFAGVEARAVNGIRLRAVAVDCDALDAELMAFHKALDNVFLGGGGRHIDSLAGSARDERLEGAEHLDVPVYGYAARAAESGVCAVEDFEGALVHPRDALHVAATEVDGGVGERQSAFLGLGTHALEEVAVLGLVSDGREARGNLAADFAAVGDGFERFEMFGNVLGMEEVFRAREPRNFGDNRQNLLERISEFGKPLRNEAVYEGHGSAAAELLVLYERIFGLGGSRALLVNAHGRADGAGGGLCR